MAPEILHFHKYDAKADLWSVGAILFELVCLAWAWAGGGWCWWGRGACCGVAQGGAVAGDGASASPGQEPGAMRGAVGQAALEIAGACRVTRVPCRLPQHARRAAIAGGAVSCGAHQADAGTAPACAPKLCTQPWQPALETHFLHKRPLVQVAGRPPFNGANQFQLLRNIERGEARLPDVVASQLSLPCRLVGAEDGRAGAGRGGERARHLCTFRICARVPCWA